MEFSAAKREFDERGFTVLRNFVDAREIATINAELERYIAEVLPGLPETAPRHCSAYRACAIATPFFTTSTTDSA
jgi:ectoine hydroxylase-related dioxygenase (phytanoyl-CoA dioxygenase family)